MRALPALLLLVCSSAATYLPDALADGYSTGYSQQTLDEAAARRALASVPGFKMDDVWFAAGMENYYKSPSCITGRSIYVFTKPTNTAAGIWRGKKAYVEQDPPDRSKITCNEFKPDPRGGFEVNTASYIDPDDIHPDEASDGQVPGIFQIHEGITDEELTTISKEIADVRSCLMKEHECGYQITKELGHTTDHDLTAALKVKNLLTMSVGKPPDTGTTCYSMIFVDEKLYSGAVGVDICYLNGKVSDVTLNDDIVE